MQDTDEPTLCSTPLADPQAYDEEWHVAFPLSATPDAPVKEHCRLLFAALEDSCLFDDEEERHVFPTGKDFYICTNWADLTRRYFGEDRAVVMGYLHEQNEASAISEKYEGHDFVVLDGRFVVDGWVTGVGLEVPGRASPGVYDLEDQADAAEITRLYGDRAAWEFSGSCFELAGPPPV